MSAKVEAKPKDICERTFRFALRVVQVCQRLEKNGGVGRTLGRQLLRAGTSIGANVEESQAGQSRADFISKTAIALKEARETRYWLRILIATQAMPALQLDELQALQTEAEELSRILGAIIVSAKTLRP